MKNYCLLLTLTALTFLTSCHKDEEYDPHVVSLQAPKATVLKEGGVRMEATLTGHLSIEDHGFVVNSERTNFNHEFSLGKPKYSGPFHLEIKSGLEKNQRYSFQSYVSSAGHRTLGDITEFTYEGSARPIVSEIQGHYGNVGDTLSLIGNYFGHPKRHYEVLLGDRGVTPFFYSDSLIHLQIPDFIVEPKSEIRLRDHQSAEVFETGQFFEFAQPVIHGIDPLSASPGDTLTIVGEHFDPSIYRIRVRLGDSHLRVVYLSASEIKVIMPDFYGPYPGKIEIHSHVRTVESAEPVLWRDVKVTRIPSSGRVGDEAFIEGTGFHRYSNYNEVLFGEAKVNHFLYEGSRDRLHVAVPLGPYPSREMPIKVVMNGQMGVSEDKFTIEDPWLMVGFLPFHTAWNHGHIKADDKVYISGNSLDYTDINQYLFEFNASDYSWKKKKRIPFFEFGSKLISQNNHGFIYVNTDGDNFYRYNEATDSWARMADFPGKKRFFPATFASGDHIYVGMGSVDETRVNYGVWDFYRYSINEDKWAEISPPPGFGEVPNKMMRNSTAFMLNDQVYLASVNMHGEKYMYEYDIASDTWIVLTDFQDFLGGRIASLVIKDKGYIIGGSSIMFDHGRRKWRPSVPVFRMYTEGSVAFEVMGKYFVAGGQAHQTMEVTESTTWLFELDPEKLAAWEAAN